MRLVIHSVVYMLDRRSCVFYELYNSNGKQRREREGVKETKVKNTVLISVYGKRVLLKVSSLLDVIKEGRDIIKT